MGMETIDLKSEVERTARRWSMWEPGHRIIVGVSGGADSVALLHVLTLLQHDVPLTLLVAHLNHRLRGEQAAEDARFVASLAQRWGLEAVCEEADVAALAREQGVGIQEAAREARYRFFQRLARRWGADRIALAHHADDQVETVLFRFIRGTGPHGLAGIPPVRGPIIRPLIEVPKAAILQHLRVHGLPCRTDPSNVDVGYRRNRIRLELIPYIEERYNPAFRRAVLRLADILREEQDFLDEHGHGVYRSAAREVYGPGSQGEEAEVTDVYLSRDVLAQVHPAMRRRVVRIALARLRVSGKRLDWELVQRVLEGKGGPVDLPDGVSACFGPGEIHLYRRRLPAPEGGFDFLVDVPGRYRVGPRGGQVRLWRDDAAALYREGVAALLAELQEGEKRREGAPDFQLGPWEAALDWDRLRPPLRLRTRRPGDRFQPLGMEGTRKLQDVFVDLKIPRGERDAWPLLADEEGIVSIIGLRVAERVRVGPETRRLLRLRWDPGSGNGGVASENEGGPEIRGERSNDSHGRGPVV